MSSYYEYSCLLCCEKFCVNSKELNLMYCPYCGNCLIREKDNKVIIYLDNIDSGNIGEDVIYDLGLTNVKFRSKIKEVTENLRKRLKLHLENYSYTHYEWDGKITM
jgi:hypothetical protein